MAPFKPTPEQTRQFRDAVANRDGDALYELVYGDPDVLYGDITRKLSDEDREWAFSVTERR